MAPLTIRIGAPSVSKFVLNFNYVDITRKGIISGSFSIVVGRSCIEKEAAPWLGPSRKFLTIDWQDANP